MADRVQRPPHGGINALGMSTILLPLHLSHYLEKFSKMGSFHLFIVVAYSWVLLLPNIHGLQNSQTQILLRLRKYLEYPSSMKILENYNGDLCNITPSTHLRISCRENSVTELRIMGDNKLIKVSNFDGYSIPNQTLSHKFSTDSFFTTLSRLKNLRVLSLVNLGMWGPLSGKIQRLTSLEYLDLSSNFLFGPIPISVSRMVKLKALVLDANYFNGTSPNWFGSLSNLMVLSLKRNRFNGHFPSSICKIEALNDLVLSHNDLSGKLPNLSNLTRLHVLNLRENRLDSDLPILPKHLVTALLSNNQFSGKIPGHFSRMARLQHLDLSYNHLSGPPLPALFSLPSITYLKLASNLLNGSLPNHLTCSSKLGFVDISANKLIGELPKCLGSSADSRMVKFAGNCLFTHSQHQHHASFCIEAITRTIRPQEREITVLIGVICGAIFVIALLAPIVLCLYQKYCRAFELHNKKDDLPNVTSYELVAKSSFVSQNVRLETEAAPLCRLFSFHELKKITKNFDKSLCIGEGSVGKLYKGKLENGTYVAVRSLILPKKFSVCNLKIRLSLLSKLHHPHLVALLGHCIYGGEHDDYFSNSIYLIYEYVPHENYHASLSENCPQEKALKWSDRLGILIGVAKAVHFLHTGVIPGSFNNVLKANNILLDEHQIAKLSDYGISIITEEIESLEENREGLE